MPIPPPKGKLLYGKFVEKKPSERIADSPQQLVFQGKYEGGQRLDEIKIAEQFYVSRAPIREALHRSVMPGLAEQIPRRSVFICQPCPVDSFELSETLTVLQAARGRFAAGRMTDEDLNLLSAANL